MANHPAPTHYALLGCAPGSPVAALRAAYIAKVARVHGDALAAAATPATEATVRLLNTAYSVLKSAASRRLYDGQLALLYRPCGGCLGTGLNRARVRNCGECQGAGWYTKQRCKIN